MIIRTQEEILGKILDGFEQDHFGIVSLLVMRALCLEKAKTVMNETLYEEIKKQDHTWERYMFKNKKSVIKDMKERLPFAYKAAYETKGLLAERNIQIYRGLAWLIDDELYKEITRMYNEEYTDYGLPILAYIEDWLKFHC